MFKHGSNSDSLGVKDLEKTLLRSKIKKNIFLAVMHGSRTNQEDLRYKCSFCIAFNVPVKSFKRTEQLQRHYHNHLNVRLYKCFSCEKRFKVGFRIFFKSGIEIKTEALADGV